MPVPVGPGRSVHPLGAALATALEEAHDDGLAGARTRSSCRRTRTLEPVSVVARGPPTRSTFSVSCASTGAGRDGGAAGAARPADGRLGARPRPARAPPAAKTARATARRIARTMPGARPRRGAGSDGLGRGRARRRPAGRRSPITRASSRAHSSAPIVEPTIIADDDARRRSPGWRPARSSCSARAARSPDTASRSARRAGTGRRRRTRAARGSRPAPSRRG